MRGPSSSFVLVLLCAATGCRGAGGKAPPSEPGVVKVTGAASAVTSAAPAPLHSALPAPSARPAVETARADSSACLASEFWDGTRCLARKEELGGDPRVYIPRCKAGDDQACPIALKLLQHGCDLDDVRVDVNVRVPSTGACAAQKALTEKWIGARTRAWATARCGLGQYAACRLLAEMFLAGCSKDDGADCSSLAKHYGSYPELAPTMDVSRDWVSTRACELGDQTECPKFEDGLGLKGTL